MTTNPKIDLEHQISLRVHFQLSSSKSVEEILEMAKLVKDKKNSQFTLKIVDQHIWFGIAKKYQKLYSPNLHLELDITENQQTKVNAKFGPDPALWTLFMFLHFGLAIASITLLIIAYANYALGKAYFFQLTFVGLIAVLWFGLYVFARVNRSKGRVQAKMLLEEAERLL